MTFVFVGVDRISEKGQRVGKRGEKSSKSNHWCWKLHPKNCFVHLSLLFQPILKIKTPDHILHLKPIFLILLKIQIKSIFNYRVFFYKFWKISKCHVTWKAKLKGEIPSISWHFIHFMEFESISWNFMDFPTFHGILFISWNFIYYMEFYPFHGISSISWNLNHFMNFESISWNFTNFMDFPPFYGFSSIS